MRHRSALLLRARQLVLESLEPFEVALSVRVTADVPVIPAEHGLGGKARLGVLAKHPTRHLPGASHPRWRAHSVPRSTQARGGAASEWAPAVSHHRNSQPRCSHEERGLPLSLKPAGSRLNPRVFRSLGRDSPWSCHRAIDTRGLPVHPRRCRPREVRPWHDGDRSRHAEGARAERAVADHRDLGVTELSSFRTAGSSR
jgi:hypothetical protein